MDVSQENKRPRWLHKAIVAAVVAAVLIPTAVVLAAHNRTDVPFAHPFHTQISNVIGAGVGTEDVSADPGLQFGPGLLQNRGRAAQWLNFGLSRAGRSNFVSDATIISSGSYASDTIVASVPITVGGISGTQFVKVEALMWVDVDAGVAPFILCYYLQDTGLAPGAGISNGFETNIIIDPSANNTLAAVNWVFPAASGAHTYQLKAYSCGGADTIGVDDVILVATTHAFGHLGANVLSIDEVQSPRERRDLSND